MNNISAEDCRKEKWRCDIVCNYIWISLVWSVLKLEAVTHAVSGQRSSTPRSDHHHHVLGVGDDDAHSMTIKALLKMFHWKRKYGYFIATTSGIHIIRPLNPQQATPPYFFSTYHHSQVQALIYIGESSFNCFCLSIMSLLDCNTSVYYGGIQKSPSIVNQLPTIIIINIL